jgi:hypothetical protein
MNNIERTDMLIRIWKKMIIVYFIIGIMAFSLAYYQAQKQNLTLNQYLTNII